MCNFLKSCTCYVQLFKKLNLHFQLVPKLNLHFQLFCVEKVDATVSPPTSFNRRLLLLFEQNRSRAKKLHPLLQLFKKLHILFQLSKKLHIGWKSGFHLLRKWMKKWTGLVHAKQPKRAAQPACRLAQPFLQGLFFSARDNFAPKPQPTPTPTVFVLVPQEQVCFIATIFCSHIRLSSHWRASLLRKRYFCRGHRTYIPKVFDSPPPFLLLANANVFVIASPMWLYMRHIKFHYETFLPPFSFSQL